MKDDPVARQIVCMLLLRKRRSYRLWQMWRKRSEEGDVFCCDMAGQAFAQYNEAHDAAEIARRILYGYGL